MVDDVKVKKSLLGRLVGALEAVSQYADGLYSMNRTNFYVKDSTGIEMTADSDVGVKLRAYDGETFHDICVQGWQPDILQKETQRLVKRLKEQGVKRGTTLKIDRKKLEKHFKTEPEENFRDIPMEEKAEEMEDIHKDVMTHKDFIECQVLYREEEEFRIFVNKYKKLSSDWTGCSMTVIPLVKTAKGETRNDVMMRSGEGFESTLITQEELERFLKRSKKLKTAKRIKPGQYKALLSPVVTGLLAHESFGHGMESDTILHGRARAEEFIGKRIATAKVSICEDPALPGTHGRIFFDDEGMLPEKVMLVERGMVRDPITDLYSASVCDFRRSANGRAESFDRKIYARMTNTFFQAGKDDPDKMLKSIRKGVYLHHGSAGMEDPKGWGVQLSGILCEGIKNGKLTGEFFYEATLGGFLPDILKNITAVGKDFGAKSDAGFCAKNHKEWVRVSSGGPHLLIKKVDLS